MTTANIYAPLGAVTILHAVDAVTRRFEGIADWYNSRMTRKELCRLTDAQLDDIGLTRSDITKF